MQLVEGGRLAQAREARVIIEGMSKQASIAASDYSPRFPDEDIVASDANVIARGTKLALVKADAMEDWYLIERAVHDGREWLEKTGANCMSFMRSARISDACIEGSAFEMREIAHVIANRGSVKFKRCAVVVDEKKNVARFSSPRNSQKDAIVHLSDADDLAKAIIETLGAS